MKYRRKQGYRSLIKPTKHKMMSELWKKVGITIKEWHEHVKRAMKGVNL